MSKARKTAKIIFEILLVLVPLAVMSYFFAYPDTFDAFLNWMVGRH